MSGIERRELLGLGAVAAMATAVGKAQADNKPQQDEDAAPKVIRIFATEDGESHLEEVEVHPATKPLPIARVIVNAYKPRKVDWHTVPQPQFTINLTGELEVETSDGTKRRIGPGDLVFLEDAKGKGHITRLLSPVVNLFMRVPPDFDFLTWAKSPPPAA